MLVIWTITQVPEVLLAKCQAGSNWAKARSWVEAPAGSSPSWASSSIFGGGGGLFEGFEGDRLFWPPAIGPHHHSPDEQIFHRAGKVRLSPSPPQLASFPSHEVYYWSHHLFTVSLSSTTWSWSWVWWRQGSRWETIFSLTIPSCSFELFRLWPLQSTRPRLPGASLSIALHWAKVCTQHWASVHWVPNTGQVCTQQCSHPICQSVQQSALQ